MWKGNNISLDIFPFHNSVFKGHQKRIERLNVLMELLKESPRWLVIDLHIRCLSLNSWENDLEMYYIYFVYALQIVTTIIIKSEILHKRRPDSKCINLTAVSQSYFNFPELQNAHWSPPSHPWPVHRSISHWTFPTFSPFKETLHLKYVLISSFPEEQYLKTKRWPTSTVTSHLWASSVYRCQGRPLRDVKATKAKHNLQTMDYLQR